MEYMDGRKEGWTGEESDGGRDGRRQVLNDRGREGRTQRDGRGTDRVRGIGRKVRNIGVYRGREGGMGREEYRGIGGGRGRTTEVGKE